VVRFAQRERIADQRLVEAIARAERGIIDADLGGGLIKQRVARAGQGRSGGYRMLVAYKVGDRAVFIYGFAKSDRENIDADQLNELRRISAGWLAAKPERFTQALKDEALQEVDHDEESNT
jgi:hypothetical protein